MSGVISTVRDIVPIRPLTFIESLRISELQATKFLGLVDATVPPLAESAISRLPRVQVERMSPAPVSGATQWSHGRWLIILNGAETPGRQRFSLAHEFKHVLDNPFVDVLYPDTGSMSSVDRAEQVCDYFAGCLLMPRMWVKRAWAVDQRLPRLARQFAVSQAAMGVRLRQIGLVDPAERCEGVVRPLV